MTSNKWSQSASLGLRMILIVFPTMVLFVNCGKFKVSPDLNNSNLAYNSSSSSELAPATDKLDDSCLSNTRFDTCIFKKSPVAQKGQALAAPLDDQQSIGPSLKFGVKLTGLRPTGRLDHYAFKVVSAINVPVETYVLHLRLDGSSSSLHKIAQIHTYYWLARAAEYLQARTGKFYTWDKDLSVYVDDQFSGFASSGSPSIHLQKDASGRRMAWDASAAVYYLAQANLHFATGGAIWNSLSTNHRECNGDLFGCCNTRLGCAKAIASGASDYMVAMVFPDQPQLGEAWLNRLDGAMNCQITRTTVSHPTLSADSGFQACSGLGMQGEIRTQGQVYASIWFSLREKARTLSAAQGTKEIDTLYMEHLADLTGTDTFATAKSKILTASQRLFGGRYTQIINSEFSARGL